MDGELAPAAALAALLYGATADEAQAPQEAHRMTAAGPPPLAAGADSILDMPNAVWAEDRADASRSAEEIERVARERVRVSAYWQTQYVDRAHQFWNKFYKNSGLNFFKDRHYLQADFPELRETPLDRALASRPGLRWRRTAIELGCGVGNAALPLARANSNLFVWAVDFSARAIELMRASGEYAATGRCSGHVVDLTADPLPAGLPPQGVDYALMLFALSAIAPEKMSRAAALAASALRPGGKLFFRDYGRYDEAQMRFKKGHKLRSNFYVRGDGTCAYYFELDELRGLFEAAGFEVEELRFLKRQQANRAEGTKRSRVWVHGVFRRVGGVFVGSGGSA